MKTFKISFLILFLCILVSCSSTAQKGSISIEYIQLNRIPAVITASMAAHTTIILDFPEPVYDRGGLRAFVKVANNTDTSITGGIAAAVRVSVTELIGPDGKIFKGPFDSKDIYEIPANSSSGCQVCLGDNREGALLDRVALYPGKWKAEITLSKFEGPLNWKILETREVEFTTIEDGKPVIEPPAFEIDSVGQTVIPPSSYESKDQLSDFLTLINMGYLIIQGVGQVTKPAPFCMAYMNYTSDLQRVKGSVASSAKIASFTAKPTESNLKQYQLEWWNASRLQGAYSLPFNFDRAVVRVILPSGVKVVNPGGAHVYRSSDGVLLLWILNAPDKQIGIMNKKDDWPSRVLSFEIDDSGVETYEAKAALSLEIGPFKGNEKPYDDYRDAPWYKNLSEAPWIYDYETWQRNPKDVYWYVVSGDYSTINIENHDIRISSEHSFNPVIVKTVDIVGVAADVYVSGGYAYVADKDYALHIIDIESNESANIVDFSEVDTHGGAFGVYVSSGYAFVAYWDSGLQIIDVEPIERASIVKSVDTPGQAVRVYVSDGYAYVADMESGLQIIDVEPIGSASIVKSVNTPDPAVGVYVSDSYAYVADMESGLQIINVEPIESARIVKSVDTPGSAYGVYVSSGYAYVADQASGLQIIDIEPIGSASIVKSVDTNYLASGVYVSSGYAYVADDSIQYQSELQIIDVEPIGSASIVKSFDIPGSKAYGVYVSGDYAYVAGGSGGLQIIKLW